MVVKGENMETKDNGPNPYVVDIEELTMANENFRTASWTGTYLQMTLMTIPVGGEVGLEVHDDTDQFLRLEQGTAKVMMGKTKEALDQEWTAEDDWAIFVPSGMWHNIVNVGDEPLKLYSIYAPVHHPHSTVHKTYEEAMEAEEAEGH
jgi:mannose-6-phosphate isomerase-like protein (cupin superfamily)